MTDVLYVTDGWCIHDDRWTRTLRELGFTPRIVRAGIDVTHAEGLREYLAQQDGGDLPILAGPLDTITSHLRTLGRRVVGLSWGFDVYRMPDHAWLADLGGVIVDSVATADLIGQEGVDRDRITYLPWGVDLEAFPPQQPVLTREDLSIPLDSTVILSLRAHEPRYHVADVIDAFAEMNDHERKLTLVVGNSGSETKALIDRCRSLAIEDRVLFIGQRTESEVADLFTLADVYVSASEVDGTSVTLLQAMASNIPCVVSDIPANRPWIEDGVTGWLFPLHGTQKLAQAVEEAIRSEGATTVPGRLRVEEEADWQRNRFRLAAALTKAQP